MNPTNIIFELSYENENKQFSSVLALMVSNVLALMHKI
jgi:hypothetical protein